MPSNLTTDRLKKKGDRGSPQYNNHPKTLHHITYCEAESNFLNY